MKNHHLVLAAIKFPNSTESPNVAIVINSIASSFKGDS